MHTPEALLRKLKAHGIEPYVATTGELRFKAPWPPTAVPAEVRSLLATAKRMRHLLAAFLRKPGKHPLCGHEELWLSRYAVWGCLVCHPPAPGAAVWPPPEELPPPAVAVPAKQQEQTTVSDLWPYPALPGQPDPLDYKWNPDRQQWEYQPGWWRELGG